MANGPRCGKARAPRSEKSFRDNVVCAGHGAATALGVGLFAREAWPAAWPFLFLWAAAPAVAWWISRPLREITAPLSAEQTVFSEAWRARRGATSRRSSARPINGCRRIISRSSPSRGRGTHLSHEYRNHIARHAGRLGFRYLSTRRLANVSAKPLNDGPARAIPGHFYNWYDTRTLQPLPPLYVSTWIAETSRVLTDSPRGLLELSENPAPAPGMFSGLADTLQELLETIPSTADSLREMIPD